MNKVVVLGAGRVGSAMARDLARDEDVQLTVADADPAALERLIAAVDGDGAAGASRLRTLPLDLTADASLERVLDNQNLAIGAVPGPLGFDTARRVLERDVDLVDISFFEEDALKLDSLARARGRIAIVDAGVAPGLSNLLLGHHEARLRETRRFECLVGGIPASPEPPWEYRAAFSPIDVIAEYTRPARLRRDGKTVVLPALSEVEQVEMAEVGVLEAFNTDGLRTLLRTSRVPDLVEKTMRWPGHADRIRVMRDSGFFDPEPVELGGTPVSPLALSSRLLFDAWRYRPGEEDLTVMRVVIEGSDEEGGVRHEYHLLDRYDAAMDTSSMARTTGYTATALARLVLDGGYREPGVSPPERVSASVEALPAVLGYLDQRRVRIRHSEERIYP